MKEQRTGFTLIKSLLGIAMTAVLMGMTSLAYAGMVEDHIARIGGLEPPLARPNPQTIEAWEQQRPFYLQRLREALNFPAESVSSQWSLQPQFVKSDLEYDEYTVKHLVFESMPGWWVTANLYLPKGISFPTAAVLYLNGHSGEGKSTEGYQAVMINFVKKGYVVLAIDECGAGERTYTGQRYNAYQYLVGNSPGGIQIWDAVRAVDYLHTIPQWVDPNRIGAHGRSGGGFQSFYLAAVDNRVALAIPENFVSTYNLTYWGKGHQTHTLDNYIVNIRRYAEEYHLLGLVAPRPLQINAGTEDFFSYPGTEKTYAWGKHIYTLYGKSDNLSLCTQPVGHESTPEFRSAAYAWFNRHFHVSTDSTDESVTLEETSRLNCGVPEASTADLAELAYRRGQELPPSEAFFGEVSELATYQTQLRKTLHDEVLGFNAYMPIKNDLNAAVLDTENQRDGVEETLTFKSEEDITISAVLRYKKGIASAPGIVCPAEPGYDVSYLVDAGYVVLSVDVREEIKANRGDNEYWTWSGAIIIGKSITAMKTWDVMRGVDYLISRTDIVDTTRLAVLGTETTYDAMYAMYAAALDTRIKAAVLSTALVTYKPESSGDDSWYDWNYALYLPRILKYADVPQLVSLIAPRCAMFANGKNTLNESVSQSSMHKVFLPASTAYELLNARDRIRISATATEEDYLSFLNRCMAMDSRTQPLQKQGP